MEHGRKHDADGGGHDGRSRGEPGSGRVDGAGADVERSADGDGAVRGRNPGDGRPDGVVYGGWDKVSRVGKREIQADAWSKRREDHSEDVSGRSDGRVSDSAEIREEVAEEGRPVKPAAPYDKRSRL